MKKNRNEQSETALTHATSLIDSLQKIIKNYEKVIAKKRQAKMREYQKEKKEGGLKIIL